MSAAGTGPPCWYAVLGVSPEASGEEVKRAFRQAALRLHPDKVGSGTADIADFSGSGSGSSTGAASSADHQFWLVQQAWQVLQDAGRRAEYDRQRALAAAAQQVHISESVHLEEMDPAEVEGQPCYSWPCRCGGSYLLLAEDAQAAMAGASPTAAGAPDIRAGAGLVADAELAVPCTTCSLHIRVLLAADMQVA